MDTAELFRWVLDNLNYWVVTLFMAIESSFIPFPSEVIVPPAAWKSMTDDSMNFILVIVFATLGADLGALVNYYLARWLGRPIVYRFADSRLGHLCLIDRQKVEHAEQYFREHGACQVWPLAVSCSSPPLVRACGTPYWLSSAISSISLLKSRPPKTCI